MNWHAEGDAGWSIDWHGESETGIPGASVGVGTFALALENGYTVTLRYPTDIIKSKSGREQRISRNDAAKESYAGSVVLFGADAVDVRNTLARYAALGSAFLLALPHEQLSIRANAAGATVYVHDTTERDWMNPGQRVVCMRTDPDDDLHFDTAEGVIQSTTANSITLNTAPGDAALIGGVIMPVRAIYLEPNQSLPRYPTRAERWDIQARAAGFDFAMALASLDLGPLTALAALDAATVTARVAGSTPTFRLVGDAADFGLSLVETSDSVVIHFYPGFTTAEHVYAALQISTLIAPTGTWGVGTLDSGDAFAATALAGGDASGPVGTGATVTTYADHPVWDELLDNDSTITDSIHAMTEILDYGGVPQSIGSADMADWGREVVVSGSLGYDFQWLKLFLSTVKGQQKAWWLSTWRDDLTIVSVAGEYITVTGDVAAWYPAQREHIHVREADGSDVYCLINAAIDNGDGTWELQTDAAPFTDPVGVSWLELCRFATDTFTVTFDDEGWQMPTEARVVQQ